MKVEWLLQKVGWYQIVVKDRYGNETRYIFKIDKPDYVFDSITLSAPEANDNGTTFTIVANDKISGIAKIELYINNKLFKTFEYTERNLKNKTENFAVSIGNIPFYENCYARGIDRKGNSLQSNTIMPNISRINDLTDLLKFRTLHNDKTVDFRGRDLYLLNDISLSGNWTPISNQDNPFRGIFHGNSHTISNLQITTSSNYQGFFGRNQGTITDLIVSGNINSNNGLNIGGIVGRNYEGTISNSKSKVTITGNSSQVGGIAGMSTRGVINNCINYNNVSGTSYVGGITGYSQASFLENCGNRASATISNTYECSGGIVRIYRI